ncbi:MAG TPA: amino acid ABC transporter permease [Kineosporiaceae bacterium]|nr:amino acid ABC transporter permease [Kineosporiaceae bacterium]
MSSPTTSVLYDIPGPRARRRALIGSAIATVLLIVLLWLVIGRLADQEQFSMERWGPLIDPSNENFVQVWKLLGTGLRGTLIAATLAIILSTLIGTILGTVRMMTSGLARLPLVTLIELFRGLPVIVTIYLAYRVLPDLGVDVSPLPGPDGLWFLVIGLTAYNSVIIAEILRAGVASLPRGQREAGLATGLTNLQTMRLILLPQSFRIMLPALISQLIVILKDTSLAALIGLYAELLRSGRDIIGVLENPIQTYFVVAIMFIALNFALSRLAVYLEARLARGRTSGTGAPAPTALESGLSQTAMAGGA